MPDDLRELRVSDDARNDPPELRRRLADEGCLFFKRLQDPDKLRSLRRDITTVLQDGGWLVAGTDPMEGIADVTRRCTEGDLEYTDVYHKVQRLESFHRCPHWPEVTSMVERIMGKPSLPLPQKIARIWFPQFKEHTTPIHQDFVHFQGSTDVLTCWAPVGDCPRELGGLAVLPGSHKVRKVLPHHFALGAGGLIVNVQEEARAYADLRGPWHTTDFEIGDTLFFPALTLHKALPNVTADRLRISLDNRYQVLGGRAAEHMLQPHLSDHSPLGWEQVYAGWSSKELQYYWKTAGFHVVRRYDGYGQKSFAEALALARRRDDRAILALRRAVRADPGSENGKAAAQVLAELKL